MVWYLGNAPVNGQYGDSQELDGDPAKIECLDMMPDGGMDIRPGYLSVQAGRPIKPDHVPTKIEWRSKTKVPDYKTPMGIPCANDRFRQIVEQFEPGVHQWFPVEFVNKNCEHLAHRWYFIPCNRIDSVDREHTTLVLSKGRMWITPRSLPENERPTEYDPNVKYKKVFSLGQVVDRHIWRDKFISGSAILISDAIADALTVEKFSGLSLTLAESVA